MKHIETANTTTNHTLSTTLKQQDEASLSIAATPGEPNTRHEC